jgi:hypothetical protein
MDNKNNLKAHCGKLRRQHKEIENGKNILKKKLIKYENKRPKVIEEFRCDKEKPRDYNLQLKKELGDVFSARHDYDIDCIQAKGLKTDKGHKTLINQYSNKIKKCNKIIKDQPKRKRQKEPTVKELRKILAENKVSGRSKLKTKQQLLDKVKELDLIKSFSELKL